MLRSSIPIRFQKAWGVNAAGAFIRTPPVNSQIGIQDGAASFETGWPPDNFTPLAGGGVPPFGQDFNGLENLTTSWDIWYQARAPISYDLTFSTAIGGYPQGSILDSTVVIGKQWVSLVDSNTTNPDDPLTSTNWRAVGMPSGALVGFPGPLPGVGQYILMNGLTIGNASSNATGGASAALLFLYGHNWLQFSNTQCPILTSAGVPTTRGANPYADFAANKQLTMPNGKGLGLIGGDTMGGTPSTFLNGVPVTIGNTVTPGSILGENFHSLSSIENGVHIHDNIVTDLPHVHLQFVSSSSGNQKVNGTGTAPFDTNTQINTGVNSNATTSIGNVNSGGGQGHNTVHRNMVVFWGQAL